MISRCPGCGLAAEATGEPIDTRHNRSWECWSVHGEVAGFELEHMASLGAYHQLTVDAYAAQHSAPSVPAIGPAFGLAGLYLALIRQLDGPAVREAHRRMANSRREWPAFGTPPHDAGLTVLDIARAGARRRSVDGHREALLRWVAAVWQAWEPRHAEVAAMTEDALGRWSAKGRPG
jgi:hypothetical protein